MIERTGIITGKQDTTTDTMTSKTDIMAVYMSLCQK